MFKILEPLKVRNSDSTTVDEEIRDNDNSFLKEDFFSIESSWAVGSFNNDFALEVVCIELVD